MKEPKHLCPICGQELLDPAAPCSKCQKRATHRTARPTTTPPATAEGEGDASPMLSPDERYESIEAIGKGGMGTVYKVHDRELDEVIAIKVLNLDFAVQPAMVEQFKQEIKAARRINHPNVVRLYHFFHWRGHYAIAQEYIRGRNLDRILTKTPLKPRAVLDMMRYLCSAIDAAHKVGVIHLDLKPGNIIIDGEGKPHILDFGLAVFKAPLSPMQANSTDAKQTEVKATAGTPAFMAPEQVTSPGSVDHRADIYSLGVILFQLTTGVIPFNYKTLKEVFTKLPTEKPPRPRSLNPDLPVIFQDVILRCLEKDPARRYDSAQEIYRHLERAFLVKPPVVARASQESATAGPCRGRVLVIDDDPVTRLFLRKILEAHHAETIEASNGHEGTDLAWRERPDLILLDIIMPKLDGREVLRILKSNPQTASIPIIILTQLSEEEEAIMAREIGAAAFLNKPVQPDVLELLIEKYLPAQPAEAPPP